jgi:hypothetical protein
MPYNDRLSLIQGQILNFKFELSSLELLSILDDDTLPFLILQSIINGHVYHKYIIV